MFLNKRKKGSVKAKREKIKFLFFLPLNNKTAGLLLVCLAGMPRGKSSYVAAPGGSFLPSLFL